MAEAGGRLFVDVTRALGAPGSRAQLVGMLGRSDPLIGDALQSVIDRGDFIPEVPDTESSGILSPSDPIDTDPALVTELIAANQASVATLQREIATRCGPAVFDFIRADLDELRQRNLFEPRSMRAIMTGMEATWWLNEHLQEWLGETNAADTLTQSVPNNVTSAMGLALVDLADAIRPYPDVIAFLRDVESTGCDDDAFLADLPGIEGGREASAAFDHFLDRYGMRCAGEIDITRPRWSERPATLVPTILSNVRNFEPGAAQRRLEHGRRAAAQAEAQLLARVRTLADGAQKAEETKRMIDRVRTFAGYREYPKYGMVSRYFVYKQALLREAERLVAHGRLREKEDVFFLRLQELHQAVLADEVDEQLIEARKAVFASYATLTPPRVFTSDGEVVTGAYGRDDLPPGALVGLAVSAGTIEGRARVLLDMAQADLQAGDILVTPFTDPSWTPLFVTVAGLVTEVGGSMTHGAVIAREYGLPAVVGVENATALIQDGQQIRVHGTLGYVEILTERSPAANPRIDQG
jgi:pyruvate,water dikinase